MKKSIHIIPTEVGQLYLFGISDTIVRCVLTKREDVHTSSPLELTADPKPVLTIEEDGSITTNRLKLTVDPATAAIRWTERDSGRLILQEGKKELTETPVYIYSTGDEAPIIKRVKTVDGERNFVQNLNPTLDHMAYRAKLHFSWKPEEQIHGLGQGEEGIYNYRGHTQYLYQHNMRIPCPWILSDQGYGVLVNCGSLMTFNDDERGSYLFLDTVEQLDYFLVAGDSVDEIISGYRELTGTAVLLPKWAYGYVQSKERYETQDEMIAVAKKYREIGVGLDCVVQDWKTWKDDDWGYKSVDPVRYPNLKEMNDTLHDLHVHSMVSVWPNMNFDTKDCEEMREHGYLLHDLATYDAFVPEARELYWQQCNRELFSGGFDSWWCDSTEPFSGPDWGGETIREPWERYDLVGSEHKKFLGAERANLYAVAHAKGIYENQRNTDPSKRVLNLTRSGYPTIQKYGTMLWSGDTAASWTTLRKQLTEGLNMSLSGMPYWTLDIGAFFTVHKDWQKRGCGCNTDPTPKWFWTGDYEDGVRDLGYRELYVRWLEMGAFLPMFRSHGTDTPREIWNFGKPGEPFYDAIKETIALRYRLMPYIYSLAGQVMTNHGTIQRSLLFDFADDPKASVSDEAFLFGKSLLIYPITKPMYYEAGSEPLSVEKAWDCYLPAGTEWYDFWTGDLLAGGQTVRAAAPLDRIPVFVKAGAILPMEAGLQYAEEVVATPLEIHVYPGANGFFEYYEDDGDGYEYEQGFMNRIPLRWEDETGTFSIGAAPVKLKHGLSGRTITVICKEKQKSFVYEGNPVTITV